MLAQAFQMNVKNPYMSDFGGTKELFDLYEYSPVINIAGDCLFQPDNVHASIDIIRYIQATYRAIMDIAQKPLSNKILSFEVGVLEKAFANTLYLVLSRDIYTHTHLLWSISIIIIFPHFIILNSMPPRISTLPKNRSSMPPQRSRMRLHIAIEFCKMSPNRARFISAMKISAAIQRRCLQRCSSALRRWVTRRQIAHTRAWRVSRLAHATQVMRSGKSSILSLRMTRIIFLCS